MEESRFIRSHPQGSLLLLKVQPRAPRNEIGDVLGEELKIRVTAPPVDAAANEAVVRLLAEQLGCARRLVTLLRGQTSRHKQVLVAGMNPDEVLARLGKSPGA